MKEYNNKNTSIVYHDNIIHDSVKIGHFSLIREGCVINSGVRIGSYTEISHDVRIDSNVQIHSGCFIAEETHIGKGSWIGPHTLLINDDYPQTDGKNRKPVTIGINVIIGANCTIMPGVTVGDNALIGAGSVVLNDVKDGEVICGNPGMFIKYRKDIEEYS